MMRDQCERATRRASDRLAELEDANADLAVATATAKRRGACFHVVRDKMARLRDDLAYCDVEADTVAVLSQGVESLRSQVLDKDVEITCLRDSLLAISQSAAGKLPLSNESSFSCKSFPH